MSGLSARLGVLTSKPTPPIDLAELDEQPMRRYLVDTSVLCALLNTRPGAVELIIPWIRAKEAATSILVYGEVGE